MWRAVCGLHQRFGAEVNELQVEATGQGKPSVTIFVNTRAVEWGNKTMAYEQVYALAYPEQPLADGDVARVEYSRGPNGGGAGALKPGEDVRVKPNMVFNVYVTIRS
jgi:hypothetical protein